LPDQVVLIISQQVRRRVPAAVAPVLSGAPSGAQEVHTAALKDLSSK